MKRNYIYAISAWLLFLTICFIYVSHQQESPKEEKETTTPFYRTLTDRVVSVKEGSNPKKSATKISTAESGSFYISAKDFAVLKKAGVPQLWEKENNTTITFYLDPDLRVVIAKQIEINNRKYLEDPQPPLNPSSKPQKSSSPRQSPTQLIIILLSVLTGAGLFIFFTYDIRKGLYKRIKEHPLIPPPVYQHSEMSNKLKYLGLQITKKGNDFYIYRDGWNKEFIRITERELTYKDPFFRSQTLSLADIDYWALIFTSSHQKLNATFYIKDKRDEQIKPIFTHKENMTLKNTDYTKPKEHEAWLLKVCEDLIIQLASISQKHYKIILS